MRSLIGAFKKVEGGDLSVRAAPAGTQEVDGVVAGFNGMVERLRHAHQAEQEAHRLEMERAEQLAAVGQLAAGLAHEFRNPLSSVKAVIEVLAEESELGRDRQSVLRDAAGELDRIDGIVKDLLSYARPKAPVVAPFDLNTVVHETLTLTQAQAVASGIDVRTGLSTDLPPAVGDADMTRQVLVNLLLNAQQAIAPSAERQVHVSTGRNGHQVWCRVRDSGPGVPETHAQTIFQPFVTSKPRGTGLGLSISRRVIELQGGHLRLDNPGQPGASFTFSLPGEAAQVS